MITRQKLFIFDLDGTLIKFHHEYLFSQAEKIIDQLGHEAVPRVVLEESFSAFDFFRFVRGMERDVFTGKFWEHFNWGGFPEPETIEGVLDSLTELKRQGKHLAIVTSRFMEEAKLREELKATGILGLIENVLPRPGDHIHWTDKRMQIREICQRLGFTPEEAVMVGDIPPDIISARDVGVPVTVAVKSGGIHESVLQGASPTLILPDVGHLIQSFVK